MSCGRFSVRISKDKFYSATLQDGRQLPLTHLPYWLKEAKFFKSLNQDLTVFWLNVCLSRQDGYPKIDYVDQNRSRGALRQRIVKALVMRRQLQRVQLTVRVRRACNPQPLNPSITISTLVHLNSPELHACNLHSSACCDMTSHYTFIPL
jgi:hypothetical protein